MYRHRFRAVTLFVTICIALPCLSEEDGVRHFTARQVFNYQSAILFESDFAKTGLDKWNISQDSRYRLAKNDPERLQITDPPGRTGLSKAVRFTVPRAPNSFRSELSLPSEKGFNERWYGASLFVPENWVIDNNRGADIVVQWHGVPGNWKPTYPNLVIAIQSSNWYIRQSFGSPQNGPDRTSTRLDAPLKPGEWVDWIIHAKWSPNADGRIRIWKDGKEVFQATGPNVYGTIEREYTPYLKTGIYHPEWNLKSDAHKKRFEEEIPGVTNKEIYVSKVVIGSARASLEDVSQLLGYGPQPGSEPPTPRSESK